jgi:hypothetical protein
LNKWLVGLASIAALVLLPSTTDDIDTYPPTLNSSSSPEELPLTVKPARGASRPLSVAEIRWWMSQYIWLQTAEARLATRRAIDRYNDVAGDFNPLCNGYKYRDGDREKARRDVDGARSAIVAAALEELQRLNGGEALTRTTQELLEFLEYKPGAIDGVYGPQTKAAIEAYQRKAGILADGLLSDDLLQELRVAHVRRLVGRERDPTSAVVVRVMEATRIAVSDAEVRISNDRGLLSDQTNEQGSVAFAAVPAGKLNIDVRRNEDRSRYTVQVTEEPRQEVLIILPTR